MSKRAEDAALKAYPPETKKAIELLPMDWNKPKRTAFIHGYELAIERAVMWLEEHADEYNGSESAFDHMEEEMITDLRKAMEE